MISIRANGPRLELPKGPSASSMAPEISKHMHTEEDVRTEEVMVRKQHIHARRIHSDLRHEPKMLLYGVAPRRVRRLPVDLPCRCSPKERMQAQHPIVLRVSRERRSLPTSFR
eukprot:scaffold207598_cov27-Tisochrysis_lutea.AAC.1